MRADSKWRVGDEDQMLPVPLKLTSSACRGRDWRAHPKNRDRQAIGAKLAMLHVAWCDFRKRKAESRRSSLREFHSPGVHP